MSDHQQSTEAEAETFWKLADSFIHLANEQYEKDGDGKVGYAMLYAAARFNAFIVAATAGDKQDLANEKEQAVDYFSEQYRKMFRENIDDYEKNFEQYM